MKPNIICIIDILHVGLLYVHIILLYLTGGVLSPTFTEFTLAFMNIMLFATLLLSCCCRNVDLLFATTIFSTTSLHVRLIITFNNDLHSCELLAKRRQGSNNSYNRNYLINLKVGENSIITKIMFRRGTTQDYSVEVTTIMVLSV